MATALEQQRPFVTLVYAMDADGRVSGLRSADMVSLREAARDAQDLWLVHDAVLLDDGRLEEGTLDGHGGGAFTLSTVGPTQDTSELLASLVEGGVRSLLLDGEPDCSPVSSFLKAGWVDQVVAYVESGGSSSAREVMAETNRFAGLITGFALRDVTRVGRVVRVSSRAVPRPDFRRS